MDNSGYVSDVSAIIYASEVNAIGYASDVCHRLPL